mmetsp:Transcript_20169/g.35866  ORF Transcript_20169/g.35866 Transcript_20169/m.35866 type:complete len:290 (+) Transcript_20169:153-1022(+)
MLGAVLGATTRRSVAMSAGLPSRALRAGGLGGVCAGRMLEQTMVANPVGGADQTRGLIKNRAPPKAYGGRWSRKELLNDWKSGAFNKKPAPRKGIPKDRNSSAFKFLVQDSVMAQLESEKAAKAAKNRKPVKQKKPKAIIHQHRRKWRIRSGDRVMVLGKGQDAGKIGIVKRVLRKYDSVIVENVNVQPVTYMSNVTLESKEVHEECPIRYHRVNLIDPVDGRATRIRIGYLADGTKVRIAVRSGEIIPYPVLQYKRNTTVYDSDTLPDSVLAVTYKEPDYSQPSTESQ